VNVTTLKIAGDDAVRLLNEHRSRYPATHQYPFVIGDADELSRLEDTAGFISADPSAIIRAAREVNIAEWIEKQRMLDEEEFSPDDISGEWPGEILEKGSISIHRDVRSRKIKPEVYLGLAEIETPWHLPAAVKFGEWNACPGPQVHCGFHREWLERFGAEIISMSGDVIECLVRKPPTDREAATELAWEQFWYCQDIVTQGCETVANLAATLLNSRYWYFWWD